MGMEEQVRDIVRRSLITYYSMGGYSRYTVSYEDVDRFLQNGQEQLNSGTLKGKDLERCQDFAKTDRCLNWILSSLRDEFNVNYLCEMAKQFADTPDEGVLRDHTITYNGVTFSPTIGSLEELEGQINVIMGLGSQETIAIELFKYLYKHDIFTGNTIMLSLMVANKILLMHGIGMLYVPIEDKLDFGSIRYGFCHDENGANKKFTDMLFSSICRFDQIGVNPQTATSSAGNQSGKSSKGAGLNMLLGAAGASSGDK